MKDCNIWCVEFKGNDGKWHQETHWHTSKKYCDDYILNSVNPEILRVNFTNLFVDET